MMHTVYFEPRLPLSLANILLPNLCKSFTLSQNMRCFSPQFPGHYEESWFEVFWKTIESMFMHFPYEDKQEQEQEQDYNNQGGGDL